MENVQIPTVAKMNTRAVPKCRIIVVKLVPKCRIIVVKLSQTERYSFEILTVYIELQLFNIQLLI